MRLSVIEQFVMFHFPNPQISLQSDNYQSSLSNVGF